MDLKEEIRKEASKTPLIVGLVLVVVGILLSIVNSSWSLVFMLPGAILIAYGVASSGYTFAVNSVSNIAKLASQHAIPSWNGEVVHTDGGRYTIRYKFGPNGIPRFVAKDICAAIEVEPPSKEAITWGGIPLLVYEEQMWFTRDSVQQYLAPLCMDNHEASLLLVKLRNEVFRKHDRERENG